PETASVVTRQPSRTRRLAIALAVVVVAAVLVAAFAWPRHEYDSVAVLPFLAAASDSSTEYVGDGIAEQVVNDLSQVSTLRVMAWATVCRYHQHDVDVRAVGRQLGVKAVLSGSLLRDGDRLMLRTELVDVTRGSQLWGKQYDANIADAPKLQQEISQDIASNLRVRLTESEQERIQRHNTASPAAYELYLKGRLYWDKRTKQGLEQAIQYFQQAIQTDPNYALA